MPTLELPQELIDKLNNGESITIEPPKKKIELEKLKYLFTCEAILPSPVLYTPIDYGLTRKTQEACELAQKRMNKINRMSQLAHQLDGEIEYNPTTTSWYVYSQGGLTWATSCSRDYHPGRIYMTSECADTICDMLNSGEFEL